MGPPPAWQGFRSLRVSRKLHESGDVTSLVLEPADGQPLTAALAGQFIVLRLRPGPDESVLLRSYSLSGAPSEDRYRISELLPTSWAISSRLSRCRGFIDLRVGGRQLFFSPNLG